MAVLGLVGTGDFVTGERPENWRQGILRRFPNGSAPLTALISMLPSEKTSDYKYHWWVKPLPLQAVFINNGGGYAAGVTTFVIDDSAAGNPGLLFRKGHILMNMRTNEHMKVTADQAAGTSVDVLRGYGETAAAAINDDDELRCVGNVNEQGGAVPSALLYPPTEKFNLTQLFRSPLNVTGTALNTHLRTEESKKQAKIEALELMSIEMEKAFLFGERFETTGPNGKPETTTRGILPWIDADAPGNSNAASAGSLDEAELLGYLEPIFRYGSTEKLALCGSTALNVLTRIAKSGSQLNMEPGSEKVYGLRLKRFVTAFGDLLLKMHPLFNEYADWRKLILILDLRQIRYRYIRDLQYLTNRQNPGDDAIIDEFLAECGLEVHHAEAFGYISNVATFA
jgi:hypothetical protein